MNQAYRSKLPLLAIHGGAGDLKPEDLSEEESAAYRQALSSVVDHVFAELRDGADALEASVEAVRLLEDEPLFNAGRGAVFTADETHEMDAAAMCGRSGRAGAIAGVRNLKNPVLTARRVLEEKDFVFLAGEGAASFARKHGMVFEDDAYFRTEARYAQLQKAKAKQTMALDHHKYGTVGAVAVDLKGNCAASTSTGGLTNKRYGRVGDSPVIGAGTFAENASCAVSCTGYGEPFLLRCTAHQLAARIRFGGADLKTAATATVEDDLARFDGDGGLIAVTPQGELVLCFNSAMMYRGWAGGDLEPGCAIG